MTPNDMLESIRETVPEAYLGSTGGNCGAIIVDTPKGELLVTTDSGPWATPDDDDHDRGEHDWYVSLWDGDGTWIDGAGIRDGDTLTPTDSVPHVVSAIVARLGKDELMDDMEMEHPNQPGIRSLWTVVLRADGGTYRRLIVSAENEDGAMDAACTIELAPLRSVVKVEAYHGE